MAYNRKIKVGSDVISSLKSMGMKEAIRYANSLSNTKGNVELIEGARRLYGSRINSASTAPKATSADAARKSNAGAGPAKYKSADAARMGTQKTTTPAKKTEPKNPYGGFSIAARALTKGSAPKSPTLKAYKERQGVAIKRAQAAEAELRAARKAKSPNQDALMKKVKAAQAAVKAVK